MCGCEESAVLMSCHLKRYSLGHIPCCKSDLSLVLEVVLSSTLWWLMVTLLSRVPVQTTHRATAPWTVAIYNWAYLTESSSCHCWPYSTNDTFKPETHRLNCWPSEAFGDSDEFRNKSVRCVQLRWKLLEPGGQCLLRFILQSLWMLAVGHLSHWILWLVVC